MTLMFSKPQVSNEVELPQLLVMMDGSGSVHCSVTYVDKPYEREAKFILRGLVKMQQVLAHHFASCRQLLESPLHVARRVTVCRDG